MHWLRQTRGAALTVLDDVHHPNLSAETRAIVERLIQVARPICTLSWRRATRCSSARCQPCAFAGYCSISARMNWRLPRLDHRDYSNPVSTFSDIVWATLLADKIDSWAIVFTLVWQQLQRGDRSLPLALSQLSGSVMICFTFLAHEVLSRQPGTPVQRFLRETALLHG